MGAFSKDWLKENIFYANAKIHGALNRQFLNFGIHNDHQNLAPRTLEIVFSEILDFDSRF